MSKPDSHGKLYVGLMSGTSMDGVDAALVRFAERRCEFVATLQSPYPEELRSQLMTASRQPGECAVDDIGRLDNWVGECFRDAVASLLEQAATDRSKITAIGSHGQTLRHQPDADRPFTLQIGDPNIIAAGSGIKTVADFRRRDVADGGQGAPLTPVFHHWLFSSNDTARVVVNIGGIANITCLPKDASVSGFDTGPGNTLLDAWNSKHNSTQYDDDGKWSAAGNVDAGLLQELLRDPYFEISPPKSTGFEYFNLDWLASKLAGHDDPSPVDIQSTLCELTATTIADAIRLQAPDTREILLCGGGVHNSDLFARLARLLSPEAVTSTADYGLDPDWVEAAAFAWLASRRLSDKSGNLPAVTGASTAAVLGGIYSGTR